MRPGQLTI